MDEKIQEALEKFAEESVKEYTQEETKEENTEAEITEDTSAEPEIQEEEKTKEPDIPAAEETDVPAGEPEKKSEDSLPKKEKIKPISFFKKMNKKKFLIGAGMTAAVLAFFYFLGAFYYSERLYGRTKIGETFCGNMTVEEAENAIKEQTENYVLEITFKDSQEEIKGQEIGYTYQSNDVAQTVLREQNPFFWIGGLLSEHDYPATHTASLDEEKLREKINSFECMKEENMIPSQDASIAFENNQFVIKDEVQGTAIDIDLLVEKVTEAAENGVNNFSAEEEGVYILPQVTSDDETLKRQQEVWNSCAVVTVTYLFGDQKEVLDGMRVKDWFTYDAEGNYVEDQETLMANIQAYTAELAAKYDTVGRSRVIRSTATGEDVTVEGGDYGFMIDQEEESNQLLQDIQGHVNTQREPVYARRGAVYGENDIGDTYVEVDLTGQHLWYYKDGSLLMDSDFVSGTYYNYERRTPAGSYYLKYKQRDQVLRPAPNPDGSYDYESPVDYWMPFNGGIGFHDADWRWVFGGSIYLYNGSHGCINLPVSFAGEFYNSLEAGCPIICFYR